MIVRQGTRLRRCRITAPGVLDLEHCTSEAIVVGARKGGAFRPSWRLELGGAIGKEHDDAFVQTLRDFGYHEQLGIASTLALQVGRELWLGGAWRGYAGGMVGLASTAGWRRDTELSPLRFDWSTTTVGAAGHLEHDLWHRLFGYADGMLGVGIGRTRFVDQDDMTTRDAQLGYAAAVGGGLGLRDLWAHGLDFELGARYSRVPAIANDIGETHDSGGFYLGVSAAYRIGGAK